MPHDPTTRTIIRAAKIGKAATYTFPDGLPPGSSITTTLAQVGRRNWPSWVAMVPAEGVTVAYGDAPPHVRGPIAESPGLDAIDDGREYAEAMDEVARERARRLEITRRVEAELSREAWARRRREARPEDGPDGGEWRDRHSFGAKGVGAGWAVDLRPGKGARS